MLEAYDSIFELHIFKKTILQIKQRNQYSPTKKLDSVHREVRTKKYTPGSVHHKCTL